MHLFYFLLLFSYSIIGSSQLMIDNLFKIVEQIFSYDKTSSLNCLEIETIQTDKYFKDLQVKKELLYYDGRHKKK